MKHIVIEGGGGISNHFYHSKKIAANSLETVSFRTWGEGGPDYEIKQ